jgi:SAM-dependent methyltransferase
VVSETRTSGPILCPRCGSEAPLLFETRDLNRRISAETFAYFGCARCDLVFLDPVPADLGTYYPDEYYGGLPSLPDVVVFARTVESYKLDLIRRFAPNGRLLDVGPGPGGFAYLAKEAGYEVDAVEMDETCCSFLSEVVGVRAIRTSEPASVLQAEGPYDVVTLWHVLEHLPDPFGMLAAVESCLKPDGVVVIAAPNPDSFQFRLFGRWWTHVDAPRHLCLVPHRILVGDAAKHGLQEIFTTTTDDGGLGLNAFGWRESLANLTPVRVLRPLARAVGDCVTRAVAPYERVGSRGATYTVVLRKRSES